MPNPNWAIYARSSVDGGDPGMQVQICRKFVSDKKGVVEKVFTDPGEAVDSEGRAGLAALIQGARNGAFSHLAVLKPDRLSQDADALTHILTELSDAGTTVWTVQKKRRIAIGRSQDTEPQE